MYEEQSKNANPHLEYAEKIKNEIFNNFTHREQVEVFKYLKDALIDNRNNQLEVMVKELEHFKSEIDVQKEGTSIIKGEIGIAKTSY